MTDEGIQAVPGGSVLANWGKFLGWDESEELVLPWWPREAGGEKSDHSLNCGDELEGKKGIFGLKSRGCFHDW